MTQTPGPTAERPLRIVFSVLHPGYLRHYVKPIHILAERGHSIHVALSRGEKDPGDWSLVEELLAGPAGVTVNVAPRRGPLDGWQRIAWMVRALLDFSRYADPRYADADALRRRIRKKIDLRISSSRIDPLGKRLLRLLVERIARPSDLAASRRWRRRLVLLERAVPTSRRIDRFLRSRRPDVLLASPVVEIGSPQVELLKSARRLGIPCGVCIASWDNLTNKGLIRVLPDRVLVWNELQRREAVELHDVPEERVVLTGAQRFDKWFEQRSRTTREVFARRIGLDPERGYLLYLCSSTFIARHEARFVARWLAALREHDAPELNGIGALIRPHPQNASQWLDVDLSQFGNAVVWPRGGAQPDRGDEWADYHDSIAHSAAVVGVNTSALIESAIAGRSVFTILDHDFAETQEGTLHFRYLLHENGGFLHVARDLDEHFAQLARSLGGAAEADAEQTRRFVASFVRPHGIDVASAPVVAREIENIAAAPADPPAPRSAAAACLRIVLTPVAAAVTLAALASFVARRVRLLLAGRRTEATSASPAGAEQP